jgi:hypothetical protein
MARVKHLPRRPRIGYQRTAIKQGIRWLWNRMVVAVAVRGILILYALLQFVLTKYRAE